MAQLANVDLRRHDMFSAMYGGYAGSISQLPSPVVLTSTFWDHKKIESTLTPNFIRRSIPEPQRRRLEDQLKFGEGLTESTYAEWILERTRKLFMILHEVGVPEKIFDLIDGSWDDDDLPLSSESLEQLRLGGNVEKKFCKKQHMFLVRELNLGGHIDYTDDEVVPLEMVYWRSRSASSSSILSSASSSLASPNAVVDKVYFPRRRDICYSRRRVPLGDGPGEVPMDIFMEELQMMKSISHSHIVSVQASYTQEDYGYVLFSPSIEMSLKTFFQWPHSAFKSLSKPQRKITLMDWLHCLSDAVSFLHEEGLPHNDIKPSSIIIDTTTNKIYLADIGCSKSPDRYPPRASSTDFEAYDYGAPELWTRTVKSCIQTGDLPSPAGGPSGWTRRRTIRSRTDTPISPTSSFERTTILASAAVATTTVHWQSYRAASITHEPSDVFSLACIAADIITFYAKRKPTAFATHRSAKPRSTSREPIPPSSPSSPPDHSFHANMGRVESWLDMLEEYSVKKHDAPMRSALRLLREMLVRDPHMRPALHRVESEFYCIVLAMSEAVAHDHSSSVHNAIHHFDHHHAALDMPHCGGSHHDANESDDNTVSGFDAAIYNSWNTCSRGPRGTSSLGSESHSGASGESGGGIWGSSGGLSPTMAGDLDPLYQLAENHRGTCGGFSYVDIRSPTSSFGEKLSRFSSAGTTSEKYGGGRKPVEKPSGRLTRVRKGRSTLALAGAFGVS